MSAESRGGRRFGRARRRWGRAVSGAARNGATILPERQWLAPEPDPTRLVLSWQLFASATNELGRHAVK
jgi:hypothetical protein